MHPQPLCQQLRSSSSLVDDLDKDPIKRLTIPAGNDKRICNAAGEQTALSAKKTQMPGAARAGIGLLIMGAILVGLGQYLDRGALSLYGLIMAAAGFALYMIASIIVRRKARR
jgi:hypothetical protein